MPTSLRLIEVFHESWKYLLVSVLALAIDAGLLLALTRGAGLHYLLANAIGFCAGLVVNYLLSVGFVFRQRRLRTPGLEFAGFLAIGLVALGLNELLMKLFVDGFAWALLFAKVAAAGVGFVFNFIVRRLLLFTAVEATARSGDG